MNITGATTALATPFLDGKVDFVSYQKLIEFQLSRGINSFVIAGSTGEGQLLTIEEYKALILFTKELCGNRKINIIATCCTTSTASALQLAEKAVFAGANALLCTVPPYVKPSQDGIYTHFKTIHDATQLPIILYNIPSRTGVDLKPETFQKLMIECSRIIGIKDSSNANRAIELKNIVNNNIARNIDILSGDDAEQIIFNAGGGSGVISVLSNAVPTFVLKIQELCKANNFQEAITFQQKLSDLSKAAFCDTNPVAIKYILHKMNIFQSDEVRQPLLTLNKENKLLVDTILKKYKLSI